VPALPGPARQAGSEARTTNPNHPLAHVAVEDVLQHFLRCSPAFLAGPTRWGVPFFQHVFLARDFMFTKRMRKRPALLLLAFSGRFLAQNPDVPHYRQSTNFS
jgi:hypothetical protein